MELESSIKEAGNGLKSVRVTDRKKNAEIVKQFLSNSNAVPSLLSENTLKKRGYTWNNLFDDISDYIFKETERFEQSKTFENSGRPLCTTLLHHCVAGSNKGKAYIKCDKITETSLYILKDNRLAKAFGDSYLNLLLKHVLPYKHYSGHITPNTWKELLDVSIATCFSTNYKIDSYTKLRLILLIMKNGKENCQFVRPLVESLSSLETYFGLVASDKKVQDVVIEIIILLLETLSAECRLTMCRFIESFLPSLLKFYDQNKDQKKKTSHFKLLNLAVSLHHPLGRHQNEEGSLANNWDIWNKYLNSITEIICLEVNYLQKNRKQNDRSLQQCSHFHSLAASVFHQIFKMSERNENDTETPLKRIKLSVNKNKTFSDLVNELQQNHVPWLGIVNEYTKLYSAHITPSEYLSLLNCLQLLLANYSSNLDWQAFKELVCLVLECTHEQMGDNEDYKSTLLSLWNSCVRSCTSINSAHQAIHTIMQSVLNCSILEYPTHLIKQYLEKEMPVTTHSVTTLTHIFQKFYSNCSFSEFREKCLAWLTAGDSSSFCVTGVPELLLRIISNESITFNLTCNRNTQHIRLHDILFDSLEKCILFSEFEIDGPILPTVTENAYERVETDTDLEQQIQEYLKIILTDNISKRLQTHTELSIVIKLMNVIVTYFDLLIKLNVKSHDEIATLDIYTLLVTALSRMYSSFNTLLENNIQIQYKVELLQLVNELLVAEYDPTLTGLLRSTIDSDTFHSINNILNTEVQSDDDDITNVGDEDEINIETLKKHCLLVLAAYCRKNAEYREDIAKLIFEEYEYNFTSDTECAFQCIEMLIDSTVQDPPLGLIFTLMQRMCQKLYRDSKATYGILKILLKIMDPLCSDDSTMKDNCFIMIKSYLQLCEDTYYPPRAASLIYECAAKVIIMSRKHDYEESFIEHILRMIKCNVHTIRLSCCYLVKLIDHFPEDKIDAFAIGLLDIFLTDLPTVEESILKDESANRTFTVFHCFVALAQSKKLSSLTIILQVIHIQKVKSLDKQIVLKVLNRIMQAFGIHDLANYLNNNILAVVYFWFSKQNAFEDLPISLFGFEDTEMFIEKHMKWLIAGDVLWRHQGVVIKSEILQRVAKKRKKSIEHYIEVCFSNIMALCMPYIVSAKYDISYCEPHKQDAFKKLMQNANKMFQTTGEMLENDRWSNIFVENIGELLLFIASHLRDPEDAEQLFDLKLPRQSQEYFYPKQIFSAILNYFEDLTDGSVLQYLCKNQTITVFKILFELWKAVTQKSLLHLKVLALHAYVVFIKSIPLNQPSDAFICNFACNSFTQVIKDCDCKDEMRCYIKGLKLVLDYLLPTKAALMRKALLEFLPVLVKQKEAGFEQECSEFINYLTNYMEEHMHDSGDVVDFLGSISSARADDLRCPNLTVFKEKLKTHKISLRRPSYETLLNIHQFLSRNTSYVQQLHRDLESQSFSEECETTIIHQFVQSLCNVLKSKCDDKTIIEACNCLSIISSYNMKTLVTVPPAYTERIKTVNPTRFFLQVVGKSLIEVLFDQDATITDEVSVTLKNLLKSLDIEEIPDLEAIDKEIIKPLSSRTSASAVDTVTDSMNFEEYCTTYPEGIFLHALVAKNSNDWLKEVTCTLLQFLHSPTQYVNNLRQVCSLKASVCRKILPALVGILLQTLSGRQAAALGDQIKKIFNNIWDQTFDEILDNSGESNVNFNTADTMTHNYMEIIQYMLDIVDFVRIQRNYYQTRRGSAAHTLNYLQLEYDKVAWAASIIDQNWAAIYYGELWAIFQNNGVSPSAPEITSSLVGGTNLQRIFRKCYVSIGETDAIEGCGTAHLTIEHEKRKHLINTGQFTDALLLHDIALSCGGQAEPALHYGAVRSLHKSGMHHLALRYIKSLPENDQLNDVKYDCLAFLGDWSDFVDTRKLEEKYKQKNCNHNSIVKAFQYACLKSCLNVQTTSECENKLLLPLNKAKLAVSKLCHNLNMKNCQNVYKVLEKLHILNDVEDYFAVRTNRLHLTDLLCKWDVKNLPQFRDFKHIETFSSQRVLILDHAAKSHSIFLSEIVSLQTQYAKLALNNRRVQMAQRLLAVAKKSKLSEDITLVESEIAWAKGHSEIALSLLRNIIDKQSLDSKLAAVSLRRYGLWMAESKRDNPREIMHKYLKKSLDVLKDEHIDVRLKVYHDIAKFADAEYKQVVTYMNSSIYENRVKCLENMKGTATCLGTKSTKTLTKEESKALLTNRKFKELDEAEIVNTQVEKDNYLHLAMRYYLLSLKQCDDNNLSVFRVISLWLDNQNYEFRPEVDETFEELLNRIPSWKFVTVLPQLAPRLTNENTAFMNNLKNMIKRCAIDHPHHTLPILFGLKNSDKDNVIMNASSSVGSSKRVRDQEPRVSAAHELVSQLRARGHELDTIITQMEKVCDAIISFANYMPQIKQKKQKIPDAENIHKLRNLNDIPVPTLTLALRKDCKYTYIHTLQSFDKFFELVGGVNCPKKINCTDSSGKVNILLIKGGDDLKQDAVMQQVFNIVNTLLEKDPVTHKNKLLIRTYKVVPMSRLSGVLEWCEGTIPMGLYLAAPDNTGAHARYRPQDISCDAARKKMIDSCNQSHEVKLAVFNKILKEFKPVFQYFFIEHYLDPVTWYERRLAYTKSVAASSMVGYILGLGDRHMFNILIDKKTAEVIHIDLGVAFELGKTLRFPEAVPFRLTRDIIAGFGSSGTEGTFKRCCEKTMQLLRDNQETLLTILEVLLCDPLYSWSVKTAQQNAPNTSLDTTAEGTSSSGSGLAARALLVVRSKLCGTDGGGAAGVAVAGQVARLLHVATDPVNLSRLFHGWQPYL